MMLQTILVMSSNLPDTWGKELALAKCRTILRCVSKEVNVMKQRHNITAVLLRTDALVEFQPNPEPVTGTGLRRGNMRRSISRKRSWCD